MIAKICHNNNGGRGPIRGCPFQSRINYVCRKAVATHCANLAGTWQDARAQMQMTRGLNEAVQHPAAHIILSWPETDCPSDTAMITAARLAMIEFGAGAHQKVIAVHRDRPNPHVHIVLNRVHPVTGKALPLWQDYRRLERACRRVEVRMGWSVDRGQFDIGQSKRGLTLVPKPQAHWQSKARDRALGLRTTPDAARAIERRSGLPALVDFLAPKVQIWLRHQLASALRWQEAHDALRNYGLRYVLHRGGARIAHRTSGWAMAASQLGTACGLWAMQRRLGIFAPDLGASRSHPSPTDPSAPGHGTAQSALLTLTGTLLQSIRKSREAQKQACLTRRQARDRLHQSQTAESEALRHTLKGSRSPQAQALRQRMAAQHKEARDLLRLEMRANQQAFRPLDAIAQAHPHEAVRRRHRDILRRAALSGIPGGIDSRPFDLTSSRQAWLTAPLRTQDADLTQTLRDAIAGYADDIRTDGAGGLLLPRRREDESIAGFTRIELGQTTERSRPTHFGASGGVVLIGPRDAKQSLVVLDSIAALAAAVRLRQQPVLIIAVSSQIGSAEAAHLQALTQGRNITIGSASDTERNVLITRLKDLLPAVNLVRWEVESSSATIQRDHAEEGQPAMLSNDLTKRPEPKSQSEE